MIRYYLTIAMFLLIAVDSQATTANAAAPKAELKPALIRGDGMLMGNNGLMIGIRNMEDKRADPYTFYYYGVNEFGDVTQDSIYRVYQNPETSKQDFVMEKIIPDIIDDSKILATSNNYRDVVFTENDRIYFNGKQIESGSNINGGIVTLVDGELRYNGQVIPSGTMVKRGDIIPQGQVTIRQD